MWLSLGVVLEKLSKHNKAVVRTPPNHRVAEVERSEPPERLIPTGGFASLRPQPPVAFSIITPNSKQLCLLIELCQHNSPEPELRDQNQQLDPDQRRRLLPGFAKVGDSEQQECERIPEFQLGFSML